jgi:hypothetical protein
MLPYVIIVQYSLVGRIEAEALVRGEMHSRLQLAL